jgi:hypothetical protein
VDWDALMDSIERCAEKLKREHGWGVGKIAEEIGVDYDTLRKHLTGVIQRPSFQVVAGIHLLAQESLDDVLGIQTASKADPKVQVQLHALETRMKNVEAFIAQGMLQGSAILPASEPVPLPEEIRRGATSAARAGLKRATAEGRGKDSALKQRTEKRDGERRTTRRKAS